MSDDTVSWFAAVDWGSEQHQACKVAEHRWHPIGLAIVEYAYRFQRVPAVSGQG